MMFNGSIVYSQMTVRCIVYIKVLHFMKSSKYMYSVYQGVVLYEQFCYQAFSFSYELFGYYISMYFWPCECNRIESRDVLAPLLLLTL